ncbi:uncharacterized protein N7529_000786 [Penicillium soppii]|uniref:uncharacterized protein n=1 Tax=Penicillium soppii TaxID=69789 RepID=UPI002546B724|nr:uncharacterized protein N7529_000786 [Penicillium soppii]KAJ5882114.1 hypothetical protein N7529_000786 [Penicillium soppii]
MARLSLSFLSVLLVLAALALSMPVKREAPGLSLDSALGPLQGATKLLPGLGGDDKNKLSPEEQKKKDQEKKKKEQEEKEQQKKDDDAAIAKANKKIAEANGEIKPTPTASYKNRLSSGNFATPTATATHKPKSKPNELSKIPLVGGLLSGAGAGL